MKSALPWVLVVILIACGYFLYAENKSKDADLAQVSAERVELDNLRKQTSELSKLTTQQDEIAKLRKENEDVLRLRADNQKLRADNKQLATQLAQVQAQNAQVVKAQQDAAAENAALRNQKVQTKLQAEFTGPAAQQTLICLNNLRVLDGAKQQWALENKRDPSATPSFTDISQYLPPGTQLSCPAGGTYNINAVNVAPTCSVPGHVLR